MNRKQQGFSLIELLAYGFFAGILGYLIFQFTGTHKLLSSKTDIKTQFLIDSKVFFRQLQSLISETYSEGLIISDDGLVMAIQKVQGAGANSALIWDEKVSLFWLQSNALWTAEVDRFRHFSGERDEAISIQNTAEQLVTIKDRVVSSSEISKKILLPSVESLSFTHPLQSGTNSPDPRLLQAAFSLQIVTDKRVDKINRERTFQLSSSDEI